MPKVVSLNYLEVDEGQYFFFPWSEVKFRKIDDLHYFSKPEGRVLELKNPGDVNVFVIHDSQDFETLIKDVEYKSKSKVNL